MTFKDQLREVLADREHATWADWMEWLFDEFECGSTNPDGSFTIRPEKVKRWKRQMVTKYADLTEDEKESDRLTVDQAIAPILKLVEELVGEPDPTWTVVETLEGLKDSKNIVMAHKVIWNEVAQRTAPQQMVLLKTIDEAITKAKEDSKS